MFSVMTNNLYSLKILFKLHVILYITKHNAKQLLAELDPMLPGSGLFLTLSPVKHICFFSPTAHVLHAAGWSQDDRPR